MRSSVVFPILAGLVAITACARTNNVSARSSPPPTAVACADASQLRQRALDDRRQRDETTSDQERIVTGSRATFYASLAIIADLKCQVTLAEADEALKLAFEAARKAEATHSFYERAVHWGEAGFIATEVVSMLTKQLPAPAAR